MNEWYLIKKLIYLITVVAVVILYTSLNQPDYQKISFYYPSKLLQRLSKSLEFIIIEPIPFEIKDSQLLGFTVFENRSHFITERLGAAEEFHFIYENDPRLFSRSRANSVKQRLLTHIVFCEGDVLIHIAILIPRRKYFWIGSINNSQLQKLNCRNRDQLVTTKYPMALDGFLLEDLRERNKSGLRLFYPNNINWKSLKAHLPYSRFLECDYENLIWPFYETYEVEPIEHWEMTKVLQTFRRLTVANEIPIVLLFGSILGWYRQCGFIEHSYDVDFATNITRLDSKLFHLLFQTDSSLITERFGSPTGGPMEWVSYGSARMSLTKVDIFGFAPTDSGNGTYIENYVMRTGHRFRYVYPNFYLNDLCCLEFEGVLLYALCDPFRSISIEHGNEWFEPLTFVAPKNKVFKEKLSEEQWRELSHNYKKHDCTEPTIRNGCDDDSDMNINKGGESD